MKAIYFSNNTIPVVEKEGVRNLHSFEEELGDEFMRLFADFRGQPDQPTPIFNALDRALEYAQSGEKTQAKEILEYQAFVTRFLVHSWLGNRREAIDAYSAMIASPLRSAEDLFEGDWNAPEMSAFKGVFLLVKGEEEKGLQALISPAQSGDPTARLLLKLKKKEWLPSDLSFSERGSSPWETEQKIAEKAFVKGDYEKAIELCNAVLEHYPEEEEDLSSVLWHGNFQRDPAFEMRAHSYLLMGRYEEALCEYEAMLHRAYPQAKSASSSAEYFMDPSYFWFGITSLLLGDPRPFQDCLSQHKEEHFWGERTFFYQLLGFLLEKNS